MFKAERGDHVLSSFHGLGTITKVTNPEIDKFPVKITFRDGNIGETAYFSISAFSVNEFSNIKIKNQTNFQMQKLQRLLFAE